MLRLINTVTYSAALPPDVRKVSDFPLCLTFMSGLCPEELGVAQILEIGEAEKPSLSAHRAAKPQAQARSGFSRMLVQLEECAMVFVKRSPYAPMWTIT